MSILETITATFAANPYLAGGVGTLVAGSVLYVLRAVPEKLSEAIGTALWTKVAIESLSNEYGDVDSFIEARRINFFSRSLELKDGALKTGFGSGWGTYDGTLFKYAKSKSTQQIAPYESINIAFLTRDRTIAERFMRDSQPSDRRNSINVTMYGASGSAGGLRRRKRSLDTVFVDDAVRQRLVDRMSWFIGAEDWHTQRGIPWKLGIILHGPPGTGKTSLIHALASDFGFNIKYIKSLHGLGTAFMQGAKTDLFVIEDIDTIAGGLNRANGAASHGTSDLAQQGSPLHEVLNAMDGMQTPDGLKFIATTNHIGRLDPAIVRPGRIDDVIEVGPLSLESARKMFKAFYGCNGILNGYTPRTGAELQLMFSTMTADKAETALAKSALRIEDRQPIA
jgi:mitochondrial chaperone BCS1